MRIQQYEPSYEQYYGGFMEIVKFGEDRKNQKRDCSALSWIHHFPPVRGFAQCALASRAVGHSTPHLRHLVGTMARPSAPRFTTL